MLYKLLTRDIQDMSKNIINQSYATLLCKYIMQLNMQIKLYINICSAYLNKR